jgi:hypothetical protein
MLNLPSQTILGELEITEVFHFYDFPRLFSCKNRSGLTYIVLSTFDDGEKLDWLYLPVSVDRLASIVDRAFDLRAAFLNPEDGYLFTVTTDLHGNTSIDHLFPEQIPRSDLPEAGTCINQREPSPIGFGAVDAAEAARASRRETYNLRLDPPGTNLPEFGIGEFGEVLTSLQDLANAIGQYCDGEPTLKGPIAAGILNATKLKATQIFEGSFGVQIKASEVSDLFENSLTSDVLQELSQLLEIADDEDRVSNKLHVLKGRVASKYRKFLKALSRADSPLTINWGSPNDERGASIELSKDQIRNIYILVNKIDTDMSEAVEFRAELLGLDVKTKRFRVKNIADDQDYSGKIAEEAVTQVMHSEINGEYHVTIKKVIETNSTSGNEHTRWVLIALASPTNVNEGN